QELPNGRVLAGLRQQRSDAVRLDHRPREQQRGHAENERRGPVLALPKKTHPAIHDRNVQAPEKQKRQPFRRRMTTESGTEKTMPAGNDACEEGIDGLPANPSLGSKPS